MMFLHWSPLQPWSALQPPEPSSQSQPSLQTVQHLQTLPRSHVQPSHWVMVHTWLPRQGWSALDLVFYLAHVSYLPLLLSKTVMQIQTPSENSLLQLLHGSSNQSAKSGCKSESRSDGSNIPAEADQGLN